MRAAIALSLLLAAGAAVAAPASEIPRLVTDGAGGVRLSVDGWVKTNPKRLPRAEVAGGRRAVHSW